MRPATASAPASIIVGTAGIGSPTAAAARSADQRNAVLRKLRGNRIHRSSGKRACDVRAPSLSTWAYRPRNCKTPLVF